MLICRKFVCSFDLKKVKQSIQKVVLSRYFELNSYYLIHAFQNAFHLWWNLFKNTNSLILIWNTEKFATVWFIPFLPYKKCLKYCCTPCGRICFCFQFKIETNNTFFLHSSFKKRKKEKGWEIVLFFPLKNVWSRWTRNKSVRW